MKNLFLSVKIAIIIAFIFIFSVDIGHTENVNSNILTLDEFLIKVKDQNGLYQNYKEQMESNKLNIKSKDLLTSPIMFANSGYNSDYKSSTEYGLTYDHKNYVDYNLGIQQTTDFGLSAKIYYDVNKTTFVDPDPTTTNNRSLGSFNIELEQDLLSNAFGATTRATKNFTENLNLAMYYNTKYSSQQLLQNAENTYWNLVILSEVIKVKIETLKQNQEMENYTAKKVQMNLMDKSNELQSRAALELAKLNLQEAQENEKSLIKSFNSMIGIESNILNEKLAEVPWKYLENYKAVNEYKPTSNLKYLERAVEASKANSIINKNKYKPTLKVLASYSSNSENNTIGKSVENIDDIDRPTKYIGLNFSVPLNFSAVSSFDESADRARNAFKLQYQQQLINDKVSWNNLLNKLEYAQSRLKLARQVENIQDQKLENEIKRWKNGISSTYQVLQFQTELTESRLNSLSIANEIFGIIANLKLFENEEGNI